METARIESILQKECRISKDRLLIVGVSGGPDSLCLLGVLQELGFQVAVAHFDHRLRPDSSADAARVRSLAVKRGLDAVTGEGDVRAMASAEHLSLEEAARIARYRFLFQTARERQAQAVAVAHTADDQVETVLMHLLRGSGLAGLKGMQPCSRLAEFDERIPLVRPLLETWREETVDYCRSHHLDAVIDPTNADRTFFRNRLRHELIPNLQTYNPRVKEGVLRMARSLAGDYDLTQQLVGEAFQKSLREHGAGHLVFDGETFRALHPGLAHGAIRMAIGALRPALRDIDFASIERAWAFIQAPPATRHIDLVDGVDLEEEGGRVIFREHAARLPDAAWPQIAPGETIELPIPGEIQLAHGWRLAAAAPGPAPVSWEAEKDPTCAWLDGARLGSSLAVRAPHPGDRFAPLGMGGKTVKLSDFFINTKLPHRVRGGWPLVYAGEELAWVAGLRSSDVLRVRAESANAVRLSLFREGESGEKNGFRSFTEPS